MQYEGWTFRKLRCTVHVGRVSVILYAYSFSYSDGRTNRQASGRRKNLGSLALAEMARRHAHKQLRPPEFGRCSRHGFWRTGI